MGYEEDIKGLLKFQGETEAEVRNVKDILTDIKDNHLHHIYKELKCITKKMSSSRPSWIISIIITTLVSTCLLLLRELLR